MRRARKGHSVPDRAPLHGWKLTVPASQTKHQFFTATLGNRKVTCFLRFDVIAQPYLAEEPTVRLPAVSMYAINAGNVDGLSIGYTFWSPLTTIVDPFFVLFHRPQFDARSVIREGAEGHNKYQLKGGLSIFVVNDDAVLITFHTSSLITEALEA